MFGWTCSNCTYVHHAPGERCVMCHELKVTKQQMQDFVRGVPIPKPTTTSTASAAAGGAETTSTVGVAKASPGRLLQSTILSQLSTGGGGRATVAPSASKQTTSNTSSKSKMSNPYLSKKGATVSSSSTKLSAAAVSLKPPPPPPAGGGVAGLPPIRDPTGTSSAPSARQQQQQQQQSSSETSLLLANAQSRTRAPCASATMLGTTSKTTYHPPHHNQNQQQQHQLQKRPPSRPQPPAGARFEPHQQQQQLQRKAPPPFAAAAAAAAVPPPTVALPCCFKPGPVPYNAARAYEWIYPVHPNYSPRQYQLEMTETAIHYNTLVSLPTGLGKTLIAAVVLYNFHVWFPTGKVVFMAPTLPLVNQQVKACYDIMGIPANCTAVLTGKMAPETRSHVWQQKSVFFCTPQTVQRDLEINNNCPARQVVCVVLDEAHKASGEYAYVKVVQLLHQAGAKFRIVGLSATPGANIQAIQQVVDALRIEKIEARSETDASVAQYTHERTSEIVIVRQVSALKSIEHLINDIMSPLLDRLRSSGVLTKVSGNATLTQYQIFKAKEAFQQQARSNNNNENNTVDGSLLAYFFAAHSFCGMRDSLHKHGVGSVFQKLQALRTQPQRGILSTIVKKPEFERLWNEASKASGHVQTNDDTNNNTNSFTTTINVQEQLANNPKLSKLCEILTEHFERARACGTSSRAIVFSQFRDSVSEIVSVLKATCPTLIRPRHFIGQGKGGSSNNTAAGAGSAVQQLKGMKQSEQHEVIREFRSNVYNVLVCTCIGEEGLDIGEVDLICNFDTLRNPIRMIQRIGRTGRKREGRVVCLVAEGSEERTLRSSKQSERNLHHALKNPKSFTCLPALSPMFPVKPVRVEKQMVMSQNFHMSQVQGHNHKKKKSNTATTGGRSSLSTKPQVSFRWRLQDCENTERVQRLGRFSKLHLQATGSNSILSTVLRRRLLSARTLKHSAVGIDAAGRMTSVLQHFEGLHPYATTITTARAASSRTGRGEDALLNKLFPLLPMTGDDHSEDENDDDGLKEVYKHHPLLADTDEYVAPPHARPAAGGDTTTKTGSHHQDSSSSSVLRLNGHGRMHHPENQQQHAAAIVNNMYAQTKHQNDCTKNHYQDKSEEPSGERAVAAKSRPTVGDESLCPLDSGLQQAPPPSLNRQQQQAPVVPVVNRYARTLHDGSNQAKPQTAGYFAVAGKQGSIERDSSSIFQQQEEGGTRELWREQRDNPGQGTSGMSMHMAPVPTILRNTAVTTTTGYSKENPEWTGQEKSEALMQIEDNAWNRPDQAAAATPHRHDGKQESMQTAIPRATNGMFEETTRPTSDDFFLPTPPDSSGSEDEDETDNVIDDEDVAKRDVSHDHAGSDSPDKQGVETEPQQATVNDDEFFLPTQESSSSEDESEPERGDSDLEDDAPLIAFKNQCENDDQKLFCVTLRMDQPSEAASKGNEHAWLKRIEGPALFAPDSVAVEAKVSVSEAFASSSSGHQEPAPEKFGVPKRAVLAIDDTPVSQDETLPRKPRPRRRIAIDDSPASGGPVSRRSTCQVRFSMEGLQLSATGTAANRIEANAGVSYALESDSSQEPKVQRRRVAKRTVLVIEDTPISMDDELAQKRRARSPQVAEDMPASFSGKMSRKTNTPGDILVDTQTSNSKTDRDCKDTATADDIVCAVCGSGESPDDDPIILCDGSGNGAHCDMAVHMSCYDLASTELPPEEEWRCDPCSFRYLGGVGVIQCGACGDENGALKQVSDKEWTHIKCNQIEEKRRRLKRLRRPCEDKADVKKDNVAKRRQLEEVSVNKPREDHSFHNRQLNRYRRFIDDEAGIDSDEDVDGDVEDEDDIAAIEDEETFAASGFINDSSQLGYSQDELGLADPDADVHHRALDSERDRLQEFATPALNRRHVRRKRGDALTDTPKSAPSSEKGLGNMHFIRSVLEHHRNGGSAEDIEEVFHELEEEGSGDENAMPEPSAPRRTVMHYQASDSEDDDL